MISNRKLVFLFFISIVTSTFYLFFKWPLDIPLLYSIINIVDEVVVLLLLFYAILIKKDRNYKNINIIIFLSIFVLCGFVGNYHYHFSFIVFVLGAFNTIKPILLFWSFIQFDFGWKDLKYFFKLIERFFILILISYFLDLIWPGFRHLFGREIGSDSLRGNLRALCGFFYRPTYATVWGLVYYIYYNYYDEKKTKWKVYFSAFIQFSSLKVKDLLGFFTGVFALYFKKITNSKILLLSFSFILFFVLYANVWESHYNQYFGGDFDDSKMARVVLTVTSFEIANDHFPFGVGFGKFASPVSQQTDSEVYYDYRINRVFGLDIEHDGGMFMYDVFWPMLLGECGYIGLIVYLIILWVSFSPFFKIFINDTSDRRVLLPCFLFIVLFIETFGKPTLSGPPHSLILWGIAGMFYSLKDKPYNNYVKSIS